MLKTTNEDIKVYSPGSPEKNSLKAQLEKLENQHYEIRFDYIESRAQFHSNYSCIILKRIHLLPFQDGRISRISML